MTLTLERIGRQGDPVSAFVTGKSAPVDWHARRPGLADTLKQGVPLTLSVVRQR